MKKMQQYFLYCPHLRSTLGSTATCRCWFTLARLSERGGEGIHRWKPGWPVDICERAFNKNWDTVFKGPRKPGTIHHPVKTRVTRGYTWTRFPQVYIRSCYQAKRKLGPLLLIARWKPGWPVDGFWRAFAKGVSFVGKLLRCENDYLEAGSVDCGKLGVVCGGSRESSWLLRLRLLGFLSTDFARSRCNRNNNRQF